MWGSIMLAHCTHQRWLLITVVCQVAKSITLFAHDYINTAFHS